MLNVGVAASDAPFALHGRKVEVAIDRCTVDTHGLRTCRGSYRINDATVTDQPVLGSDAAQVGSTRRATIDARHPGVAASDDPTAGMLEALAFALAATATALVAARGAVRARTRSSTPAAPPTALPKPAPGDDPLAWVRRRRFGAGH